tara:strand:- start:190 stop:1632 length:1443 start_codon:yes stop_codon:yes gene_type:complete
MDIKFKPLIASLFLLGSLCINAQDYSKTAEITFQKIDYFKSGDQNSTIQRGNEIFYYGSDEQMHVASVSTGKDIRKFAVSKPFKKSKGAIRGNVYSDGKDGAFIIYDTFGEGWAGLWNPDGNNFDNMAFYVAQKYDSNWKPVGSSVSLMATDFDNKKAYYTAGIFFNEDSSKFAVVQSKALQAGEEIIISRPKLPLKIVVFDRSLKKLKEIDLTNSRLNKKKKSGALFRFRDVSFAKDKISVLVSYTNFRAKKAVDEYAESFTWDLKINKVDNNQILIASKEKSEKLQYARFLPGQHSKLIMFYKDFKSDFHLNSVSIIRLIDIANGKVTSLDEWSNPESNLKKGVTNSLCLNDVDGRSKLNVFKTSKGEYLLIAAREINACVCDRKSFKKWHFFLTLKVTADDKIKISQIPIAKQSEYIKEYPFMFDFKNDKLYVYSLFSPTYYVKGDKSLNDKLKEKLITGILEVDTDFKTKFVEVNK